MKYLSPPNILLWHQLTIQVHWTSGITGYWAIVKDLSSGDWLSCNDKVVLTVPQHSLNNTTSYIFFLQEKLSIVKLGQGGFVFLNIVFGCDDPTYYPSPGRRIEFAHSIFRYLRSCKTLARGLTNLGYVFED